jgi:hypothetical protein
MKLHGLKTKAICLFCLLSCAIQMACKKLIEIGEPINTLTTSEIFSTDATATSAMYGVYSSMINGFDGGLASIANQNIFSAGLTTRLAAVSADELFSSSYVSNISNDVYRTNKLTVLTATISPTIWSSAYSIIYKANSVIEGIEASKSASLHNNVRIELTAEARFIRAFCYFYLTNFFGDVPMALTVDFNKTANLPRMPRDQVYQQIITDLKAAQAVLAADDSQGKGERVIPNKWAATLLLARVYLYTGDYNNASAQASSIISNHAAYHLETDLNQVFSTGSREAVWQLKQTQEDAQLKNATPEGLIFSAGDLNHHGYVQYGLTSQLLSAFEPNDRRWNAWLDSTDYVIDSSKPGTLTYFPHKYILGTQNASLGQAAPQYYMVLRLAEAYLIRAEAAVNGAPGGMSAAITDLNVIRYRAGLPDLDPDLDQLQIRKAIARERQVEFFAEWGHRWFDLKRTGQAGTILSAIPAKQPWLGDNQLLYPIPRPEIIADHFLTQNPGY